ncbi:MAG: hypothetical protein ACFE9L_15825 [Candidatus Hodarchaeota archaeon]
MLFYNIKIYDGRTTQIDVERMIEFENYSLTERLFSGQVDEVVTFFE